MFIPNLFKRCRFVGALVLAFGLVTSAGAQMGSITPSVAPVVLDHTQIHIAAQIAADIAFEIADGTMAIVHDAVEDALATPELSEEQANLNLSPADK